jgi:septum formation protein
MELENLKGYEIILASKSPRRKQLLEELGLTFSVRTIDTPEVYPENLSAEEVPAYLAELKATPFLNEIDDRTLVITSDTIVYAEGRVLGKPDNYTEAFEMLQFLSGKKHEVATGVCIATQNAKKTFTVVTDVYFKELSHEEIDYYITHFEPYDKAGAYGIQEWIGFIAIERIEGSYFNVMGLPVHRLYEELRVFNPLR